MKPPPLLLFLIFWLIPVPGMSQSVDDCFSNYPAEVAEIKDRPELQFLNGTEMFRTRISNAYEQEVSFAGHYIIASWGCGTGCQSHALIDVKTGEADYLSITTSLGLDYRNNSRLLIANPDGTEEDPEYARPKFYVFEDDSVRAIESKGIACPGK